MADITPGYDFGTNEVPRFATMLKAASALSIVLDFSDLAASDLTSILSGTTSGTTGASLPDVAWMWADPAGNLWIEQAFERQSSVSQPRQPCYLYKALGGWATVRYATDADPGQAAFNSPGAHVTNSDFENRLDDDSTYWEPETLSALVDPQFLGCLHDSGQSGVRQMLHGRGGAKIVTNGILENSGFNYLYSDATAGWEIRLVSALLLGPDGADSMPEVGQGFGVVNEDANAWWVRLHGGAIYRF